MTCENVRKHSSWLIFLDRLKNFRLAESPQLQTYFYWLYLRTTKVRFRLSTHGTSNHSGLIVKLESWNHFPSIPQSGNEREACKPEYSSPSHHYQESSPLLSLENQIHLVVANHGMKSSVKANSPNLDLAPRWRLASYVCVWSFQGRSFYRSFEFKRPSYRLTRPRGKLTSQIN